LGEGKSLLSCKSLEGLESVAAALLAIHCLVVVYHPEMVTGHRLAMGAAHRLAMGTAHRLATGAALRLEMEALHHPEMGPGQNY